MLGCLSSGIAHLLELTVRQAPCLISMNISNILWNPHKDTEWNTGKGMRWVERHMGRHIHLGFPHPLQSTVVRLCVALRLPSSPQQPGINNSCPLLSLSRWARLFTVPTANTGTQPPGACPSAPKPGLTNTKRPIPCFCFPRYGHLVPAHFLQRMQEAVPSEKKE